MEQGIALRDCFCVCFLSAAFAQGLTIAASFRGKSAEKAGAIEREDAARPALQRSAAEKNVAGRADCD
jgi:hypothetical protein